AHGQDGVVARLDAGHVVADLDDFAQHLVPDHELVAPVRRPRPSAARLLAIGPADPDPTDPDLDLVRRRDRRLRPVDDPDRRAPRDEGDGLHVPSSRWSIAGAGSTSTSRSPSTRRTWTSTPSKTRSKRSPTLASPTRSPSRTMRSTKCGRRGRTMRSVFWNASGSRPSAVWTRYGTLPAAQACG